MSAPRLNPGLLEHDLIFSICVAFSRGQRQRQMSEFPTAQPRVDHARLCNVSRSLWQAARRRLAGAPDSKLAEADCSFFQWFYATRSIGGDSPFCIADEGNGPSVQLSYLRQFKCANNFLRNNLFEWGKQFVSARRADQSCHRLRREATPDDEHHRDPWGRRGQTKCAQCMKGYRHAFCEYCRGRYYSTGGDAPCVPDQRCAGNGGEPSTPGIVFTVVRNPVARFLSGYGEVMHRKLVEIPRGLDSRQLWGGRQPPRSPRQYLIRFLAGEFRDAISRHTNSMLGPITAQIDSGNAVDFVGSLEDMSGIGHGLGALIAARQPSMRWRPPEHTAWRRLASAVHGMTDSSSNQSYRLDMEMLLKSDPVVNEAISCAVTLPDSVCFGYSIPECGMLRSEMGLAQPASWSQFIGAVAEVYCPWKSHIVIAQVRANGLTS